MSTNRPILILHHAGDVHQELDEFFTEHNMRVIGLDEYETGAELTHILTTGEQDFHSLGKLFNTLEDDVRIVALSAVKDYPAFVANNGRFIVDQKWFTEPMGKVTLEKFFQGRASVHLEENFPSMKTGGQFRVLNHLRVGQDLDRLSAFVHQHDGSLVNVRTFVDHALYYLFYLKQAGIGGAPFEVDYGHTGHETVVQIHLPVKNYVAEYLLDSFGHPNGQDPLRYLLAVCAQSVDFMEVQYIQSAAKLVITGLWQNRKGVRTLRFGSLMINKVLTTAQIERQIEQQILEAKRLPETAIEQLNDKPLPGHLLEMVMPETAHEGYLKDHPDLARNLVAFVIDQWRERHPDVDIAEVSENQMMDLLTEYYDSEETAKLGEADLQHVLERVRKNNVSKAYEQEIERVRGSLKQDDAFQHKLTESFADKVAEKISAGLEEASLDQLVKGGLETPDVPVVVSGGEDQDSNIMVRGSIAKDNLIQRISGSIEEDVGSQMIKGAPMKVDDFIVRISKGLGDEVKGDWKFKSNLVENTAPKKVRHQLERFAASMGQTLDKLSSSDLQVFAQTELPKVLSEFVMVDESFVIPETILPELPDYKIQTAFQDELKSQMAKLYPGKSAADVAGIITAEEQEKLLRSVVKSTVKQAVTEQNSADETILVKSLSGMLKTEEEQVKTILQGSHDEVKKIESEQVIQRLFTAAPVAGAADNSAADPANAILIQRLRQLESEFNQTKGQLEAAKTEVRVLKEARAQMAQINQQAREAVAQQVIEQGPSIIDPSLIATEEEEIIPLERQMQIVQDLSSGKQIDERDTQRLKDALEREQKIIQAAKQAEIDIRKAKLEMQQKEAFFQQEIEKANRALKSRDLVVQKAKDGLAMVVTKKDKEIRDLNAKISALVGGQAANQQNNHVQKIRALEQEKQSMSRLVDVYKNKLSSMATNMEKQGAGSNPKKDEEVRKLAMDKQRLEVAMQAAGKEVTKLKGRMELDQAEVQRLRAEKKRLEEALKSAISTTGPVMAQSNTKIEDQTQKIKDLQQELVHQSQAAGKYEMTVKGLEQKVAELTGALARGPQGQADQATKGKMLQMENTVKKLSADFSAATNQLAEAKKEINKARSENTALKNQIDKLKKDMEKAKTKPAAPGKKVA